MAIGYTDLPMLIAKDKANGDSPAFQKINELFRFSLRMDCKQPVEPVELILF